MHDYRTIITSESGKRGGKASLRRILVQRFPFRIYFRNHGDSIEVIGIRHFRMRPLFTRRRRS